MLQYSSINCSFPAIRVIVPNDTNDTNSDTNNTNSDTNNTNSDTDDVNCDTNDTNRKKLSNCFPTMLAVRLLTSSIRIDRVTNQLANQLAKILLAIGFYGFC